MQNVWPFFTIPEQALKRGHFLGALLSGLPTPLHLQDGLERKYPLISPRCPTVWRVAPSMIRSGMRWHDQQSPRERRPLIGERAASLFQFCNPHPHSCRLNQFDGSRWRRD
jgi:hypothetical protein